jgi:hypothetical protein
MSSMENSERCILPYLTQGPLDFRRSALETIEGTLLPSHAHAASARNWTGKRGENDSLKRIYRYANGTGPPDRRSRL